MVGRGDRNDSSHSRSLPVFSVGVTGIGPAASRSQSERSTDELHPVYCDIIHFRVKNCIFCNIVEETIPSYKVWEDEQFLAFLSIAPQQRGHTLLIPKIHTDYVFDLSDQDLSQLVLKAKPLAKALKLALKPATGKVGVVFAGMGVAHVHMHLIPMDSEKDLNFSNARSDVKAEEFEENLKKIKEVLF